MVLLANCLTQLLHQGHVGSVSTPATTGMAVPGATGRSSGLVVAAVAKALAPRTPKAEECPARASVGVVQ